jgi:hypothetical protein
VAEDLDALAFSELWSKGDWTDVWQNYTSRRTFCLLSHPHNLRGFRIFIVILPSGVASFYMESILYAWSILSTRWLEIFWHSLSAGCVALAKLLLFPKWHLYSSHIPCIIKLMVIHESQGLTKRNKIVSCCGIRTAASSVTGGKLIY